ncbi:diguanylate cyclase domain-containing protein [Lamprocystis purpurea]|uniref:diguanylate cyclase domain-containing protein n=1 Tax=Lamprocystis purpurea TaxID=61598 RepID=UPI0009FC8BF2
MSEGARRGLRRRSYGLKRTNDTLGHEQGDALILAVAAALRGSCRASDEAYRIGGDDIRAFTVDWAGPPLQTKGLPAWASTRDPLTPGCSMLPSVASTMKGMSAC